MAKFPFWTIPAKLKYATIIFYYTEEGVCIIFTYNIIVEVDDNINIIKISKKRGRGLMP